MSVQSSVVDGVPVHVVEGRRGVVDAELLFGVGLVDEPLQGRGLCHLVEHLVLGELRDARLAMNGSVDHDTTTFTVSGPAPRVRDFLERLCLALADLPTGRLEVEKGVLAAEDGADCHPIVAALLAQRYGATGAGLAFFTGRPLDDATAQEVRDFAQRWFVSGNAVLSITGDLSEDLRLPLVSSAAPHRPQRRAAQGRAAGPALLTYAGFPEGGSGVLLHLPWSADQRVVRVLGWLLPDLLEERCRHQDGNSYDVFVDAVPDADGLAVAVGVDAREGRELAVARALLDVVLGLVERGPTEQELARAVTDLVDTLADPDRHRYDAVRASTYRVLGLPDAVPPVAEELEALVPEDVRQVMAGAAGSAVFFVGEESATQLVRADLPLLPVCGNAPSLPRGDILRRSLGARLWRRVERGDRLLVAPTGLGADDLSGLHFVAWDEVVAVVDEGELVTVIGENGCLIMVSGHFHSGAERVVDLVRDRVEPALFFRPAE